MYSPRSDSTTEKPRRFQGGIEVDLLGGHALAFDDALGVVGTANAEDIVHRLLAVPGPADLGATRLQLVRELRKVTVQMLQGIPFDGGGGLAGLFEVPEGRLGAAAGVLVVAQGALHPAPVVEIHGAAGGVLLEDLGGKSDRTHEGFLSFRGLTHFNPGNLLKS
jgi:hypothetical protein